MNFLQRIKDSASRVSEKAQSSVEIGKINSQISDIEREMGTHFMQMGKLFYEGYRSRDLSVAEGRMTELSRACVKLEEKIELLRQRIAELKNERLCKCGHVVGLDANFCPSCGRKLEKRSPAAEPAHPPVSPAFDLQQDGRHPFFDEEEFRADEARGDGEQPEAAEPKRVQGTFYGPDEHDPALSEEEAGLHGYELYEDEAAAAERDRRLADELERERERQLELDRRIRDWKESGGYQLQETENETGMRDMVKCQICRADLPKGSMWCPRCGSEQI
ncbi:zinc ribbon domain-containing protein [Paenibacillus sp. CN-4]|uniref:zinc ribbon domain-containing protein n=1 Tax=Paenibacillus nanchangensis TaxID=3348343 RepID=UPI003977EB4E